MVGMETLITITDPLLSVFEKTINRPTEITNRRDLTVLFFSS
ncbi:hypothetical protein HanIR_Chr11g0532121 [Helianthus annuus]|nr:hypothetical protein HanIR_Chr11g0532121 [Helianthus annuus]